MLPMTVAKLRIAGLMNLSAEDIKVAVEIHTLNQVAMRTQRLRHGDADQHPLPSSMFSGSEGPVSIEA